MADARIKGRDAYGRQAWADAYAYLSGADRDDGLEASDLELLARAAHLTGKTIESEELLARAHGAYMSDGDVERAASAAFWIGFKLLYRGEQARGSGWLARAQRVVDNEGLDCVVQGYLLLPSALGMLAQGEAEEALKAFARAGRIGERYEDTDLLTLGRLGQGQALIKLSRTKEGVRLLDETMVAVTAGDVSPIVVGIVYCAVLSACHDIFDLRRAQEWTAAFSRWCASRPDLVPFRGECLIYRAEIMQVHGNWSDALDEAKRAGTWLAQPPGRRAAGAAFYREAEVHRLRGEFDDAQKAFREAGRWGHSPQPGEALLQLAQGQTQAATAAIRRAVDEAHDRRHRSVLLAAAAEIYLEAGHKVAARRTVDELSDSAADVDAPYLDALRLCAEGALLLVEESHHEALATLRRALVIWRELAAPYEAARTQVLIARACRALGDPESCEMELDEARRTFERLGARPDLERLDKLADARTTPAGLTPREVEVLELIATGMTNRAIADDLFISEKTVARHVSNIFTKLHVSSRAAATAYAYEHGLV